MSPEWIKSEKTKWRRLCTCTSIFKLDALCIPLKICLFCIRDPASLVKPLKSGATDDEKAAHDEKVKAATAKANRIIVMVRHGQYNLKGNQDSER